MALEKFIKRYTSIAATIDILRRKELPLLDPQNWDDRNDRHFMGLYKEFVKSPGLYAACFAQSGETYHHWRVFTAASDGACVEFHRHAFEKHVKRNANIRAGAVTYLKLDDMDTLTPADMPSLPFIKRIGFEPEEEYRIIATTPEQQAGAIRLPIDLKLINRIYFNPWIPDSVYDSVKDILSTIDGAKGIEITKSRLIDNQRWKRAGNKVAGKPVTKRVVLRLTTKKKPSLKKPSKMPAKLKK